jgi:hypothetical protein
MDIDWNQMRHGWRVGLYALVAAYVATPFCFADEPPLRIDGAGVQAVEDGPFVPADHVFGPGESVYFTFEAADYRIQRSGETRRIKLDYSIRLVDSEGALLAPEETGEIDDELSEQDKDWRPKRRAVFVLPSYLAAGQARLTLTLNDRVAKSTAKHAWALRLGGEKLTKSEALGIQLFRFYRGENDREPIAVAAYRPGDTLWMRFDVTGFKAGPKSSHDIRYELQVIAPDGHEALEQKLADEGSSDSFYPAAFVAGVLSLATRQDMQQGEYTVVLTASDLVGGQTYTGKYKFELE